MIHVRNLSKIFRIPHVKKQTLFHTLTSLAKETYDYEEFFALRDVSFSVKNGEFLGVIGRNGSGKSTLMKILSNVYLPTSGEVVINDAVYPLLELGIGFQADFTVRENIYLYGAFLGFTRSEMKPKLEHILAWTELERFADAKLDKLSSGMKMRLGFAIAIQSVAPIVIADEILAVGDKFFVQKCRKVFKEFKEEGKTVVLVSHDTGSIIEFCDRVLVMQDGRLIGDGNPKEMVDLYLSILDPGSTPILSEKQVKQPVELPAATLAPKAEPAAIPQPVTISATASPAISIAETAKEKPSIVEKPLPVAAKPTQPAQPQQPVKKLPPAPPSPPPAYNAKEFWEKRLAGNFTLRAIGNIMFDDRYNEYLYKQRLAALERALKKYKIPLKKKKILDVGCGTGYFTKYYLEQGAQVVGVDIAPVCIERLQQEFPEGEFHIYDITSEKHRPKKLFDIIHFFGTSFHIVDDKEFNSALAQCNKMLKAGGYLFITDMFSEQDMQVAPHVKFRSYERYRIVETYGMDILNVLPMHHLMNRRFKNLSIETINRNAPFFAFVDTLINTLHLSGGNDVKLLVARKRGKQQR